MMNGLRYFLSRVIHSMKLETPFGWFAAMLLYQMVVLCSLLFLLLVKDRVQLY